MEAEAGPSRTEPVPDHPPSAGAENGSSGNDDGLPPNASETLYLHNLNEKVRIPSAYHACCAFVIMVANPQS